MAALRAALAERTATRSVSLQTASGARGVTSPFGSSATKRTGLPQPVGVSQRVAVALENWLWRLPGWGEGHQSPRGDLAEAFASWTPAREVTPRFAAAELLLGRGIYLVGGRDHNVMVTALRVKGKRWLRLSSRHSRRPRSMR